MQIAAATHTAVGHTIWIWPWVGIHTDGVVEEGARRLLWVMGVKMLQGLYYRVMAVIWRQAEIHLLLHPSAWILWYDGGKWGLNTQLSSAIISDGWSRSRASMAYLLLTHLNTSVCLCVLFILVSVDTECVCNGVCGISKWCRLIIFRVLDNRLRGTKEEICFLWLFDWFVRGRGFISAAVPTARLF